MLDPDGELLARAYAGDEAAFVDLYERHRRVVFRFAYRMVGSVPVAEDLTHETVLVLLTHKGRYDAERGSLRTFLCAVVRHLALKHLRRHGAETLTDEPPESLDRDPSNDPAPLRRLLENERSAVVQDAVAALPPLQREVVILFEYEGQSLAEIAQIVEADTGTVKSRLHRARARLRRALLPWLSGSVVPLRRTVEKMA